MGCGRGFQAARPAPGSGKPGLFVQGDFVVVNGTKSAAVETSEHGTRRLYAVEATRPVFEDFGTATLDGGQARVPLDPVFAALVNSGVAYHVFLTPRGDCNGLYVAGQDATGFTVRELGHGTSRIAFDYRVLARVRGQEGARLEPFTPPGLPAGQR